MAAPTDLPDELRHQVANDCEQAANLLDTQGWQRHRVWNPGTGRHKAKGYNGGALCAIGALAVAHNETRMRNLADIEEAYATVTGCPAGQAVADEIIHRAQGTDYQTAVERYQDALREVELPGEAEELLGTIIFDWNDRHATKEDLTGLLRDVAAKYRPDEADGGLM